MSVTMSSNFFPMLSSSPPPIDDEDDDSVENDDDDFGMYASAHNAFDSGLDSPVSNKSLKSKDKLTECEKNISSSNSICVSTPCNHVGKGDSNVEANDLNTDKVRRINCVNSGNSRASKSGHSFISNNEISSARYSKYEFIDRSESSPCLEQNGDVGNEISLNLSADTNDSSQEIVPLVNNSCDGELEIKQPECLEDVKELQSENTTFLTSDQKSTFESIKGVSETVSVENYIQEEGFHLIGSEKTCESLDICDRHVVDSSNLPSELDVSFNGLDSHPDLKENEGTNIPSSLSCRELPDLNLPPYPLDDDDDFEDFQDANFALSSSASNVHKSDHDSPCETKESSEQCNEIENDSFGDFESVGTLPQKINQEFPTDLTSPDEFADFESCVDNFAGQDPGDYKSSDGDGFANFEAAKFSEPVEDMSNCRSGDCKVSKVLNAVFPLVIESPVDTEDSVASLNTDVLDQNSKSRRLWEKLHDNDQTPGLPFQWAVSHSFQQLLRSINVDYHSILRTSTVPFFASGLGLLEPVKGTATMSDLNKINENSLNLQPNPIPPVHFDWSSSGLVNPLDYVQTASTLMDLSFLCSSTTSTSSSKNKNKSKDFRGLENELLKPLPEIVSTESTLKPQILEKLLSSNNTSVTEVSQPNCRPPNLSQEAVHVLDQLPDISFMKAKVLMFPIAGT